MSEDDMEERKGGGAGNTDVDGIVDRVEEREVEMGDGEQEEEGMKGMEVDIDDLPTMPPITRGEDVPELKKQLEIIEGELLMRSLETGFRVIERINGLRRCQLGNHQGVFSDLEVRSEASSAFVAYRLLRNESAL
jgi:hypothetical protein